MELLYIAVFPVLLLLFYIYKKDIDKEPRGILTRLLIFGGISVIPLAILEAIMAEFTPGSYLPTFFGTFVVTFVGVGLIEEFGKWFITYICTYRRREYNHAYDGIVYAVFASLGFACIENILYVFQSGFGTGVLRAVLAVPGHAVDAIFMGVLLSKSKQSLVKKSNGTSLFYLLLSILIPAIIHSIYDGLLFYYIAYESDEILYAFIGFVLISYVLSFIIVKSQSKINTNFDGTFVKSPLVQNNQVTIQQQS